MTSGQGGLRALYERYREMVNYVVVGALTTLVSLGSYWICTVTFLDARDPVQLQVANVISWVCAVAFAYVANRAYVFQSGDTDVAREALRFVAARLSTLLVDMGCMALFVSVFGLDDKGAKLLVQVIVFVLNYVASKFIVFRRGDGRQA